MVCNVSFINTYPSGGGAAIACNRLLQGVNDLPNINTTLINDGIVQKTKTTPIFPTKAKYNNLIRYFTERYIVGKKLKPGPFNTLFSPAIVSAKNILQLIKKSHPDIIHLHWINHGFIGIKALQKIAELNKPIVWTLHDMWAFTGGCHHSMKCNNFTKACGNCFYLNNPKDEDFSNKIFLKKQKLFKNMDITIVCPSNWLAKKAKQSSLIANFPIKVIPNPIDITVFKAKDKLIAKQKLNLPQDKILLCFVSANVNNPFKGVDKLIEALNNLESTLDNKNDVEIVILGKSDTNTALNNIPFKIHYGGYISTAEEMIDYYNAADVFVLPSLQDNLPNTVMEALACGTPVVAFDTGGVSDMVDTSVGYLAKYKDSNDLSNGLKTLIENTEMRKRMSDNALEKVKSLFSTEVVAQQYSNVYDTILANK